MAWCLCAPVRKFSQKVEKVYTDRDRFDLWWGSWFFFPSAKLYPVQEICRLTNNLTFDKWFVLLQIDRFVKLQIWAIPSPKHEQNKIYGIFVMIQYFWINMRGIWKVLGMAPYVYQDQDQDSLLVKRRNDNHSPGPVIRELVPSSHQRSELSNTILCNFSGWDQRIGEGIPIPDSLEEEATFINICIGNGRGSGWGVQQISSR